MLVETTEEVEDESEDTVLQMLETLAMLVVVPVESVTVITLESSVVDTVTPEEVSQLTE